MQNSGKNGRCRQVYMIFGNCLGGHWPQLTRGRCSEVVLTLKLLGRDLGLLFLTGGRYLEVVVSTGLTVHDIICIRFVERHHYAIICLSCL